MGAFDDILNEQPGTFDDILADQPKGVTPSRQSQSVGMSQVGDRKNLPPLWEVTVNVNGQPKTVRGVYDSEANAYLVPNRNGEASFIAKGQDGSLQLRPISSKGKRTAMQRAGDVGLGLVQGANDLINTGASAVEGVSNLVGRGVKAVTGIDLADPELNAPLNDAIRRAGLAGSAEEAAANQDATFNRATGDSLAGTIGRVGGQTLATLPVGQMKVREAIAESVPALSKAMGGWAGRAAEGAVQGGVASGLVNQGSPEQAGMGAGGGLIAATVLPPALRGAVGVARTIFPSLREGAAEITPQITAEAQAAAEKAGLSWDGMAQGLRDRLLANVAEAKQAGATLTPEQLVRKSTYEAQGLVPTKALVTRDWTDAWKEQNLLTEPEGDQLRRIYEQNNAAVREATSPQAVAGATPVESPAFGAQFRGDIRANEAAARKGVSEAYKAAESTEGGNLFDTQPLVDFLQKNVSRLRATGAGQPVIAELEAMGVLSPKNMQPAVGENGIPGQGFKALPITMKEAVSLREIVNRAWRTAVNSGDESAQAQLNDMRQLLNRAEQQAGGDKYKAARQARQAKGSAFENNPLVDQILSKQGGYNADRIDDSQIFEKVILGSTPERFLPAWNQVSKETRQQTAAQLADYIQSKVFGNQARNEAGDVVASAAKLNKALADVGDQKLRLILGKDKAAELKLLAKSLGEISNPPKGTVPQGSAPKLSFLSNAVMRLLNGVGKLPGNLGGDIAKGAAGAVEKGGMARANEKAAKEAVDIFGPYRRAKDAKKSEEVARPLAVPFANLFGLYEAPAKGKK